MLENLPICQNNKVINRILKIVEGIFLVFLWLQIVKYIDLKIAWGGFSPIFWIYKSLNPVDYVNDFPSGIELYDNSAFMYIYKIAYSSFGLIPEKVLPVVILIEIVSLSYALHYLTRTLLPSKSSIVSFSVIILAFGSYAWNISLARFGYPFLVGQFYNVADALGILGIAMAIRSRMIASFILLAMAYLVHPIVGLTCLGFVAGIFFLQPQKMLGLNSIIGALIFCIATVTWTLYIMDVNSTIKSVIPIQQWIDLTRLCNYHWYPINFGLFGVYHYQIFIPLLSFLLLFLFYILRKPLAETEKKVLAGMIVIVILTLGGIVFSALPISTTLIKLSLHRAQRLIIIIGLIYVVKGLWEDFNSPSIWRSLTAIFVLISPAIISPGYPVLGSFLLCSPVYQSFFRKKQVECRMLSIVLLSIVILGLLVLYKIEGVNQGIFSNAYTGLGILKNLNYIIILIATLFLSRIIRNKYGSNSASLVLVALMMLAATNFVLHQQMDKDAVRISHNYKEAQLWARDNTPQNSLFMVDPTIYYGWRDYSQRSSFGNLREWIHTGWMYKFDEKIYREGFARFNEFDIDISRYLTVRPGLAGFRDLSDEVGKRYNSADDVWRLRLAQHYGIDYFLFLKKKITKISQFPVAFENEDFIIYKAVDVLPY